MGKKIKEIKRIASPEALFFTAFIARLVVTTWYSTMFPQFPVLQKIALVIMIVCAVTKILLYDSFSLGEIVAMGLVGACTVLNFLKTGSNIMVVLLLLVVAAKGIDFKKILRVYIIVVGSIVAFAFICSLMGVIRNLKYYVPDEHIFRNSFGIIFCTDFAAHIFFLILAYFYVRSENLKWYDYILAATLIVLTFKYTNGKLDFITSLLTIVLFAIGNTVRKQKGTKAQYIIKTSNCIWKTLAMFSMTASCIFMYLFTLNYSDATKWMVDFNEFITGRLNVGQKTLAENGFGFFGKRITMYGAGGNTVPNGDTYNFIDCSYLHILVLSGLALLLVFLMIYTYSAYKNGEDVYLMYAIILISINCMIAHHLQDISYNPFTLMIMAKVLTVGKENEKSKYQFCINN